MKRMISTLLMTAIGAAIALPAAAQFAKPEDAIKYRKSALTVMSTHFGRVAGMANGKIPFDAKAVSENADIAAFMSKLPFVAFIPGSDQGQTKAEPKIWTEKDKFDADAKTLQDEMAKLATVAKGGNIDAIKAQVGETGKACKACHDNYRKE
jgi:cytochrome c556